MVIHNSENASMLYIKKKEMLYCTIVGFSSKKEISDAAKSLSAKYKKIKASKVLIDFSQLGTLRNSDFKVIVEKFYSLFRETGIEKAAFIKSSNPFGQIYLKMLTKEIQIADYLEFDDMISAEKWLLK